MKTVEKYRSFYINKPTRVTRKTTTSIDYIFTNSFIDTTIKTGIIRYVSDQFPICLFIPSEKVSVENEIVYMYKRIINDEKNRSQNQSL